MSLSRRRFLLTAAAVAAWPLPLRADLRRERFKALGTRVEFRVVHEDARYAGAVMAEARRAVFAVHGAMTSFEPSPLQRVNALAYTQPVGVPAPLFRLLRRCLALHRETGGRFDPTVGGLVQWRRAVLAGALPVPADMLAAVAGVGMRHVQLDEAARTVRLTHPQTRLELGGVAKGFAVDEAVAVFRARGIEDVLVDAGGDIYAAGRPAPTAPGWAVDVAAGPGPRLRTLHLRDRAVATSGNYHQPAPHILDPRDGSAPARVRSATALAPDTAMADAWATAAFVGEPDEILALARAREGLQLILVLADGSVRES